LRRDDHRDHLPPGAGDPPVPGVEGVRGVGPDVRQHHPPGQDRDPAELNPLACSSRLTSPPSIWPRRTFLDTPEDTQRCIRYVEGNPGNDEKPPQCRPFVVPYPDRAPQTAPGRGQTQPPPTPAHPPRHSHA